MEIGVLADQRRAARESKKIEQQGGLLIKQCILSLSMLNLSFQVIVLLNKPCQHHLILVILPLGPELLCLERIIFLFIVTDSDFFQVAKM